MSCEVLRTVVLHKQTDVSEILSVSIITYRPDDGSSMRYRIVEHFLPFIVLTMEAVSSSETVITFYQSARR